MCKNVRSIYGDTHLNSSRQPQALLLSGPACHLAAVQIALFHLPGLPKGAPDQVWRSVPGYRRSASALPGIRFRRHMHSMRSAEFH